MWLNSTRRVFSQVPLAYGEHSAARRSGCAGWTFGFQVRGSATPRQRACGAAPFSFPRFQRRARKRPTCYGRPFPSEALFRAASIGEMHLTFNQGIKARLLGDSLFLGPVRLRRTLRCAEHPAQPDRPSGFQSGGLRPPDNAPAALPPFFIFHHSLARKRPTCGAQTLPVRTFPMVLFACGERSAARSIRHSRMDLRVSSQGVCRLPDNAAAPLPPSFPFITLWRGSGRHAERRPFPFALFLLGCKHTRRCSRLLTGRTRFESWASHFLRSCSPTANAPLRGASGCAGWTFGFHVRGSATP